jgi:predicted 3-demethylubiquinone-9 3-methyltransferase (glyoxalase superfamily)
MNATQKIKPCLWFDFKADEAAAYYVDVFGDGRVLETSHYPKDMPGVGGRVLVVEFELFGQRYQALNGGPQFPFTEAISLSVDCKDQDEVDRLWARFLADGGTESQCGWLKDKYGLSWQIVPHGMQELMSDKDPARQARAMKEMMTQRKLDLAAIQRAANG